LVITHFRRHEKKMGEDWAGEPGDRKGGDAKEAERGNGKGATESGQGQVRVEREQFVRVEATGRQEDGRIVSKSHVNPLGYTA
jgi:hypothetical protein